MDIAFSNAEALALEFQVKQLKQTFENLAILEQLGLVWRGILYAGLVGTLGSRLERQASWERFKEDLNDVPGEMISTISGVDFIGKARLIFNMIVDLTDKEEALRREAEDLKAKYTRAREFVELYLASMLRWGEGWIGIQKAINDLLELIEKRLVREQQLSSETGV